MGDVGAISERLMRTPSSVLASLNMDKLSIIHHYSKAVFGGDISLPSVVVAGTKGKGSTCAVIDSVFRESGLKVGLYTSPHLVTPLERIRIHGRNIESSKYIESFNFIEHAVTSQGLPVPPWFATHTLIAAHVFQAEKVDAAVIECGIGGRFDWTQMFVPSVGVITHLEFDHTEILGKTADSIAWNKAGILKPGLDAFSAEQRLEFKLPLIKYAKEQRAKLKFVDGIYQGPMGLRGPSAAENTKLGIEASACFLKKLYPNRQIKLHKGAENASISGRYQEFVDKDGFKWLLDGAHTLESCNLCHKWYLSVSKDPKMDVLIISTTKSRRPDEILSAFKDTPFKKVIFVTSYAKKPPMAGATSVATLEEAVIQARSLKPAHILVTGSLHLVGDTLSLLSSTSSS